MARYTETLGVLINAGFFGEGGNNLFENYPIYKEEHRQALNRKIIEHYWNEEIGTETPYRFKFYINRKMREIMPYYNQRWRSEWENVEGYNPLWNIGLTDSYTREILQEGDYTSNTKEVNKSETTANNTQKGKDTETNNNKETLVYNDVPASGITQEQINNNTYVTNYNRNSGVGTKENTSENTSDNKTKQNLKTDGETTQKQKSNQVEKFTHRQDGSSAGLGFSVALKQWRDIMLNIDMEIIDALAPCFMGLF